MAVQLQKVRYIAEAVVEGGRQGHGRTTDGRRGNIEVTLTVDGTPLAQAAASAAS